MRRFTLLLIAALCVFNASSALVAQAPPLTPFRGLIDHVTTTVSGSVANNTSEGGVRSISGDGRYVVFSSSDWELVPNDFNWSDDVFLRDRTTGVTTRLSVNEYGGDGDGISQMAAISTNGRHVAFASGSSNLVSGDSNNHWDVFVRDLDANRTVRVSVATDGAQGDADAYSPSLSADGRYVTFISSSTTFAPNITQYGPLQIYLHDRDADGNGVYDDAAGTATSLVSIGVDLARADQSCARARVSADGRYVMFESSATNLDPVGNPNGSHHLYLRDRQTGQTRLIDRAVTGGPSAWGISYQGSDMSDDGRFITYSSVSQDIDPFDMNWISQVFIYDAAAQPSPTNTVISRTSDGTLANGSSYYTTVSGDGRFVAFMTAATNLAGPQGANQFRLVVRDNTEGTFTRVDVLEGGIPFDGEYVFNPSLSADGTAIAFQSDSQNAAQGGGYPSPSLHHIFVATAFSVSPASASFVQGGGSGSIEVNTSAVSGWSAESENDWIVLMDGQGFGAGPRTVQYLVSDNPSGIVRIGRIRLGDTFVAIHQEGDGDTTPPVITPIITGTQVNGWYTSDIVLQWSVTDPDSEIVEQSFGCSQTYTYTTDFILSTPSCEATSHGGAASVTVPLRRDTTPPDVWFNEPRPAYYPFGSIVYPYYTCYDSSSSPTTCTGPATTSPLDTWTRGRNVFTVTATDEAGHTATKSVEYLVGVDECVSMPAAPAHLKRWLKFDGELRDSILGVDAVSNFTSFGFQAGVAGQGYSTNDPWNFLWASDAPSALAGPSGLTVAMWVKPLGWGQFNPTLKHQTLVFNPMQYHVARWNDGTLRYAFNTPNGFTWVNTGVFFWSHSWAHIALTYNDGVVQMFLNGSLVHSQALSGALTTGPNTAGLQIGGRNGLYNAFIGVMDDVMIFDTALPASDIDNLALSGSGSLCAPFETNLTVQAPQTITFGSAFAAIATLTDGSGRPLQGRKVTLRSAVSPPEYVFENMQLDATGSVLVQFPISAEVPIGDYPNAITVDFAGDDAYAPAQAQTGVWLVAGTPLVYWVPEPLTYGTPLSGAQQNAVSMPGSYVYSPPAGTLLGAGLRTISVTITPDDPHWAQTTVWRTINVAKATPTIEMPAVNPVYNGQPHSATPVVRGVGGVALTPFTVLYNGSTTPPVNAGTYPIEVQFAGNANYAPETATGTFVIEKAIPTVTATGGTFTYDNQPHAGSGAAVGVLGETLTPVTLTYDGSSAAPPIDAGAHTVRASYAGSSNYHPAQSADATLTINRATPTVEFQSTTVSYNGSPRSATVIVRGVGGALLSYQRSYDGSQTEPTNAGSYTLHVQVSGSTNYEPISATTTFVITKAWPRFPTFNNLTFTYDGQPHPGYNLPVWGVFNEPLTPLTTTYNGSTTPPVTVGDYTAVLRYDGAANYEADSRTYTLTILVGTPLLTWEPDSLTYGQGLGAAQLDAIANVPGTFVYNPPAGTILSAGFFRPLFVTFTPDDAVNYRTTSIVRDITVFRAHPQIVWAPPANIVFGTALSTTQLSATANTAGTFVYNHQVGAVLSAGQWTLSATFTPDDWANYHNESISVPLTVVKATPAVSWNPSDIVYGTALGAAQLNATANVPGTFAYSPAAGAVLNAGSPTLSVTFTPANPSNYTSTTSTVTLNVAKATPTISWSNPADIVYGAALGAAQLNATANVAGTFAYSRSAGTVLNAGSHTLSVTFTPSNANYDGATASVTLNVAKAGTTLIWQPVADPTYPNPLGVAQLNAFAVGVDGTFTYSPPAGTILNAGIHTLSVTFTPTDPANYNGASATVLTQVYRAASTISWPGPAAIGYGTALGGSQLNATANVPGTFTYSPPIGSLLNAGWHTLSVTFTPDDAANYVDATSSVALNVTRATPAITWSNPADVVYGTALGAAHLNATANVAGTFSYSPAAGAALNAGSHTLSVTFTPDDAVNYNGSSASVSLTVNRAQSAISWSNPADVVYGTALGAAQLNATANVAGTFSYSPAAGAALNAGSHTLSVTFTPDDAANYNGSSTNVSVTVTKAASTINWANPVDVVYGTALGAAQLNATANVAGTFSYSPAAGTVLNAGSQTLAVTFTPDDSANYNGSSASVTLNVAKAATSVTWSNPADIVYGTALGGSQLNATANVAGTFAYSPAAGTVLGAGPQTLTVMFTPDDSANYAPATANVSIAVGKAAPVITWATPAGIPYGTMLSGTQLNATANVNGSFVYTVPAASELGAGMHELSVTFTPADGANYTTASRSVSIVISPAALTVSADNASKVYGQALPSFTATGTGFVNGDSMSSLGGALAFATEATATSAPGSYSLTPSGVSSANYVITFAAGTLTVNKASTSLTLTTSPSPSNNNQSVQLRAVVSAVAPGAGTATGTVEFRENGTLLGTATLVNGVATMNKSFKRGTHPLTATYAGSTNFIGSSGNVTHQTQ
jgi:hypothetical protein